MPGYVHSKDHVSSQVLETITDNGFRISADPVQNPPDWVKPICVAHRGFHNRPSDLKPGIKTPKNSMEALRAAVAASIPAMEYDIRHTRDGVAVLLHDASLFSTADSVQCQTAGDLAQLDYAFVEKNCRLKNGEPYAPLEAVLAENTASTIHFVELKDAPNEQTAELLVRAFIGQPERLRIISFSEDYLAKIEKLFIELTNGLFNPKKLHLAMGLHSVSYAFEGIDLHRIFEPNAVDRYHLYGFEVSVWTHNSWQDMLFDLHAGVDFITTDDPMQCLKLMWE